MLQFNIRTLIHDRTFSMGRYYDRLFEAFNFIAFRVYNNRK